MAATIDATVGGANANSYLTLAEAQAIIDQLVESDAVTAWAAATTDQQNRALISAADRLDRERYLGARATSTQAMQWPRTGVRKPDTYINTYAISFPFRLQTDYFTEDEIPVYLQRAQATLAVALHNEPGSLDLSGLEEYRSVTVGPISVTRADAAGGVASGADRIPPMVERYLVGLRISGPGNIALRRS